MKIESVAIDKLIPYKDNPRRFSKDKEKSIKKIAKSIKEFGVTQPIVCDQNYTICIGHTRLQAMKSLGLKKVPILKLTLNEESFKALNIADNKAHEFTDWDFNKLYSSLKEFPKELQELTLFDLDELAKFDIIDDAVDGDAPRDEGEDAHEAHGKETVFITLVYTRADAKFFRDCVSEILESSDDKTKEAVILRLLLQEKDDMEEPDDGKEYYNKTITAVENKQ